MNAGCKITTTVLWHHTRMKTTGELLESCFDLSFKRFCPTQIETTKKAMPALIVACALPLTAAHCWSWRRVLGEREVES